MAALQLVPEDRRSSWRVHRVTGGETLAVIGKLYGAAPASILAANPAISAAPAEGDRLLIPAVAREEAAGRQPLRTAAKTRVASRSGSSSATSAAHKAGATRTAKSTPLRRKSPPILTDTASR